jgi:hypothetical protein
MNFFFSPPLKSLMCDFILFCGGQFFWLLVLHLALGEPTSTHVGTMVKIAKFIYIISKCDNYPLRKQN